jgi:hypothetical protein
MNPLTANLKHLYQHHTMWICYLLFIPYILMPLGIAMKPDSSLSHVSFILLYTGFWGAAIGSIATDVWNKPFAFVLPGHTKAAQKMLVLTWLFVTLLGTTSMAVMFLCEIRNNYAVLTALMGITSLIYWAGFGLFSSHRRYLKDVFFIFYMFPIILIASSYMRNAASSSLIAHPSILTFTGGLMSYLIYLHVTNRDNMRQMCGRPWKGFLDGLNTRKQKKLAQAYMQMKQDQRPGRAGKLAGNFFSERIRNSFPSMSWPHIWGQTYLIVGPMTIFWKNILTSGLVVLFLIFLTSFSDAWKILSFMEFMLVIMTSVIGGWIGSAYKSDFIMLVGRNAHFRRGIIAMSTGVILATVCICITIIYFELMTYIFPSAEGTYSTTPVLWILPIIPVMLSPLFGTFMILLLKPFTGGFTLGLIIVILSLLTGYGIMNLQGKSFIFTLIIFLLCSALSWGFHISALYYDCTKRALC